MPHVQHGQRLRARQVCQYSVYLRKHLWWSRNYDRLPLPVLSYSEHSRIDH
jgi:hypothetical protein